MRMWLRRHRGERSLQAMVFETRPGRYEVQVFELHGTTTRWTVTPAGPRGGAIVYADGLETAFQRSEEQIQKASAHDCAVERCGQWRLAPHDSDR